MIHGFDFARILVLRVLRPHKKEPNGNDTTAPTAGTEREI
jgi:hypothetical protein